MKIKQLLILLLPLLFAGCFSEKDNPLPEPETSLAEEILLIDTHMDTPMLVQQSEGAFNLADAPGHFNYEKAREGGLDAVFMAVYIPPSMKESGGAFDLANEMIDRIEESIQVNPEKFAAAFSPADIEENYRKSLISLPIGIENGTAIEAKLTNLKHFYDRGVRYMTLTHSRANEICDSSFDEDKVWQGLSPFGREVVTEMNRLGMMVDISHVSDQAFYQVLELSRAPVLATHSSARHFVPGLERNMSDEMIKKLAEKGGIIQINFCASFLDQQYAEASRRFSEQMRDFLKEEGLARDDPRVREFREKLLLENPLPEVSFSRIADHIEHVVDLVGVDYVGLGSDFDGIGDAVPTGMENVSKYPNLIDELERRNFNKADIEKICGGNLLRVWRQVEQSAEQASNR